MSFLPNPLPKSDTLIQTAIIFIQHNPILTALLVFLILVLDTLYIYRMWKRAVRKHPRTPAGMQPSKKKENPAD
jgi:hypothetical protein